MWVIMRADEREMAHVSNEDEIEKVRDIIYKELLEIYDGDEYKLSEDIADGVAEYNDSDLFAWTNRRGDHDIKAFWI